MEIEVTEDTVTGAWRFQVEGNQVEVETRLGFVKVNGRVHRLAAVEGLSDVEELRGAPLDAILRLIQGHEAGGDAHPPTQTAPASADPPAREERPRPSRRPRRKRRSQAPANPSKPAATTSDGALPTPEAAQYVGLRPATLETMRTRGGGPAFVKLGRRVVYRREDLDAWLRARVRKSTSDPGSPTK